MTSRKRGHARIVATGLTLFASLTTGCAATHDDDDSGESSAALESVSSLEAQLSGFARVATREQEAIYESAWTTACVGSGDPVPHCVVLRGDSRSRTYYVHRYEHADGRVAFIVDPNLRDRSAWISGPVRPGKYRAIGKWSSAGPFPLQPVVRFELKETDAWGSLELVGAARADGNPIPQVKSTQKATFDSIVPDASGAPTKYSAKDPRLSGWGTFTATKIERDDAPELDPTLEKFTEQPLVVPGTYRLPMWDETSKSCSATSEATVTVAQAGPVGSKTWGLRVTIDSDDDACTSGGRIPCVSPPSLGSTTVTVIANNHNWRGLWSNSELPTAEPHVVVRFAKDGKPRWVHRAWSFTSEAPRRYYEATFGDGTTVFHRFKKGGDPLKESPIVSGCGAN